LKGSIISAGSSYAISFAAQKISENLWLSEKFGGITHIRFLNDLADNFKKNQDSIINKLNLIKNYILENSALFLSFIGNDCQKKIISNWSQKVISCSKSIFDTQKRHFSKNILRTGIVVPAAVAYNAGILETVSGSDENAPALLLIGNFLTYNYLWNVIRVKRGAYGASANYSSLNGVFSFSTYRDPCIKESFETFKESLDVLEKGIASKKQLEQAIIGTLKKLDKPIRPEDAVNLSLLRYIKNITDEHRQKFKTLLLELNLKKVKQAAYTILKPGMKELAICSISGKKQLEKANTELKGALKIENLF
jgi:Zn-dependent M16 (insulinase) family peptidase